MGFSGAKTSKSLKKSRAARAKDNRLDAPDTVILPTDAKSEEPAKMTYSKYLTLGDASEPKNMPMSRPVRAKNVGRG